MLCRLIEYIFCEGKLYLVFEHVDKDLKKYMVATDGPLKPALIKVFQITAPVYYINSSM